MPFTFQSKALDPRSPIFHLFMLGTDTSYTDQTGYIEGEVCRGLYDGLENNTTIVDGPIQSGPVCYDANSVPSGAVGLVLQHLSKQKIDTLNVTGHSRGAVGSLILAHELDRIKNALNLELEEKPEDIKKIVLKTSSKTTSAVLNNLTKDFNDQDWINLKNNIKELKLNMFLLDPVPGNYKPDIANLWRYRWQDARICKADHYEVASIVEKIHIQYAQDERSHQFDPIILRPVDPTSTQLTVDSLPGHHGTASGNIGDRGVNDQSQFTKFAGALKGILLDASAKEILMGDGCRAVVLSDFTTEPGDNWIAGIDLAHLSPDKLERLKENVTALVTQLGEKYSAHVLSTVEKEKPVKEYIEDLYKYIRADFNAIKTLTELKRSDFFNTDAEQSKTQERLELYTRVALLKEHFQGYRKTYYDGLQHVSSDDSVMGRQVRCGSADGRLQDHVWIPIDGSPYINAEHRDLVFKQMFSARQHAPTEPSLLTAEVGKISSILFSLVTEINHTQGRRSPKTVPQSALDENKKETLKELFISYLSEIFTSQNREQSVSQLFEFINRLQQVNIKNSLFITEKNQLFDASKTSPELAAVISAMITGAPVMRGEDKGSLEELLNHCIGKSLANFHEDIIKRVSSTEQQIAFLSEAKDEIDPSAAASRLNKLLLEIDSVVRDVEFIITQELHYPSETLLALKNTSDTLSAQKLLLIVQQENYERIILEAAAKAEHDSIMALALNEELVLERRMALEEMEESQRAIIKEKHEHELITLSLKQLNGDLRSSLESTISELTKQREINLAIAAQIDQLKSNYNDEEIRQRTLIVQEHEHFIANLSQLEAELKASIAKSARLEEQVAELQTQLKTKQDQLEIEQVSKLESSQNEEIRQRALIVQEHEHFIASLSQLEAELKASVDKSAEFEERVAELQEQLKTKQDQLEIEQASKLESTQNEEIRQRALIVQDHEHFIASLSQLEAKLKVSVAKSAQFKEQVAELQEQLKTDGIQLESLKAELEEKEKRVEKMTIEHQLSLELEHTKQRAMLHEAQENELHLLEKLSTSERDNILDDEAARYHAILASKDAELSSLLHSQALQEKESQIHKLEAEKAALKQQLDAKESHTPPFANWGPEEEKLVITIDKLKNLLEQYKTHLDGSNKSNKIAKDKNAIISQLEGILNKYEWLPSKRIEEYRTLLIDNGAQANLSEHRNSIWSRFVRDSLRIIALTISGVALFRSLSGQPVNFFKPSHGENFCKDTVNIVDMVTKPK